MSSNPHAARSFTVRGIGLALTLAACMFSSGALAQSGTDACAELPERFQHAVELFYAGARVASAYDYSREDVQRFQLAGQACPAIAAADANGDGVTDTAFLVVTKWGHVLLLAARSDPRTQWHLDLLRDWGTERVGSVYVSAIRPGLYLDVNGKTRATARLAQEPGELKRIVAPHAGFVSGGIGSSGAAYFYAAHRWVHVWLAD